MPAATGESFTILTQPGSTAPRRAAPSAVAELWNALLAGARRVNAYRTLQNLDDRTLKDIGMHRTEISSVLHHDLHDPSRRTR